MNSVVNDEGMASVISTDVVDSEASFVLCDYLFKSFFSDGLLLHLQAPYLCLCLLCVLSTGVARSAYFSSIGVAPPFCFIYRRSSPLVLPTGVYLFGLSTGHTSVSLLV